MILQMKRRKPSNDITEQEVLHDDAAFVAVYFQAFGKTGVDRCAAFDGAERAVFKFKYGSAGVFAFDVMCECARFGEYGLDRPHDVEQQVDGVDRLIDKRRRLLLMFRASCWRYSIRVVPFYIGVAQHEFPELIFRHHVLHAKGESVFLGGQ